MFSAQISSVAVLRTGALLVAAPTLSDPNFAHSVVVLIQHDYRGSIGLIVNRPSDTPVTTLIEGVRAIEDSSLLMHFGGPVDGRTVHLLVRSDSPIPDTEVVLDDVFVLSQARLTRFLRSNGVETFTERRYFAGYAGWAPGQLAAEVSRRDWEITDGASSLLFSDDPQRLWPQLNQALAGEWVLRQNKVPAGLAHCDKNHDSPERC